jgi:hypothetical protein
MPSTGATNYNIERSTTSGGTYTIIGAATGTNYMDTNVMDGTTYYYEVSAVASGVASANSLPSPAVTPMATVLGVTLTISGNQISFPSQMGVTYMLLSTNSAGLTAPIAQWPQVGASLTGDGNVDSFTVTPGATNAFYVVGASAQ